VLSEVIIVSLWLLMIFECLILLHFFDSAGLRLLGLHLEICFNHNDVRGDKNEEDGEGGTKPDGKDATVELEDVEEGQGDAHHPVGDQGEDRCDALPAQAGDDACHDLGHWLDQDVDGQHPVGEGDLSIYLFRAAERLLDELLERRHY